MNEMMENAVENVENAVENTGTTGKTNESKAEKFMRLAERRINRAIDAIGRIESLANRSSYDYTPEQVEDMFSSLESRTAEVKAKFAAAKTKGTAAFSFGSKTEQAL